VRVLRFLGDVALVLWIILWTIACTWLACSLGGCTKVTDPALNPVDSTNVSMYRDSRDTRETRANENTFARSSRLGGASPVDAILVASPGPRVSYLKGDTRK
jgi:hypothetical protein